MTRRSYCENRETALTYTCGVRLLSPIAQLYAPPEANSKKNNKAEV